MALSQANSKAVFERALKEMGLLDQKQVFEDLGYTTHAELAYAFHFNPSASDDTQFQTVLADPILGAVSDTNKQLKKPALRRLHFESYTIAMADIQAKTTKTEDEVRPAKLPVPERAVRMKTFKASHQGISFEGELEPSNVLIDKIHTMRVSGWGYQIINACSDCLLSKAKATIVKGGFLYYGPCLVSFVTSAGKN